MDPPQLAPRPPRLVYVLGTWRSGSTILGVLLGSHPDIYTMGELYDLPGRYRNPKRLCSCGAPAAQCEFWAEVRRRSVGRVDLDALDRGEARFERYGSIPRTILSASLGSEPFLAHVARSVEFLNVIGEVAGVPVLVDLSKDPVRGRVRKAGRRFGLETYYIHIVRDGRAVIYSRLSRPGGGQIRAVVRNAWGMTVRWVLVNLLSTVLCGRPRRRYLRILYEDLVSDPAGTLVAIGRFLDMDFSSVVRTVAEGAPFKVDHLIGANPFLRIKPAVRVGGDFEWRAKLPSRSQKVFWLVAGALAWHYGYGRAADMRQ